MILVSDKSTQKTYYFPKEKNSGKAAFLKLFSHLSKNEYLFNVSGSAVLDLYYALSPDFSGCYDGEYDYTIYDAENNVLQNGLLRIGEYDAGDIIYDFKEEYIVYNPETGESEIIEYGDCTDAVNEAYRSGYTSGYAVGYEEGSESGTGGYESGYTSGYTDGYQEGYSSGTTDGFNCGYSSGKTDGLKEGFDNGVVSGFSGGYSSGYTDGYGSGYESGNTDGFNSGYTNGYTDGYSSGWTDGYTSGSTPTPTPPTSGFESMYFTIQPLYDGNISWDAPNLSYRIDNGSWMPMSGTVAVEGGQELQIKGTNTCYSGYTITADFGFDVYGNIMSLVYGDNFENQTTLTEEREFCYLFQDKLVRNAENLILPATTLSTRCYESMFYGCRALLTPPSILPATTLATSCYADMFDGCLIMTSAPELPATTLAEKCYNYMFYTCTSLVEVPSILPATTLATSCYESMFGYCSSLTEAPELPATTLAERCYNYMFGSCGALLTVPELPATTLATSCYQNMFGYCSSLTEAPILSATTLAQSCYYGMFYGCTSLTTAPELPATTLAQFCYRNMFYNCSNLNYIKCLATDISANNCLNNWVNGVASAGTFVKADEMSGWTTGNNGIPVGWVVENEGSGETTYLIMSASSYNLAAEDDELSWNWSANTEWKLTIQTPYGEGETYLNAGSGSPVYAIGQNDTYSARTFTYAGETLDGQASTSLIFTQAASAYTPTPSSGYTSMPFTVQMLENGNINWAGNGKTLYQINGGERQVLNGSITGLSAGDEVQFTVSANTSQSYGTKTLTATGRHNIYGNIMSLLYVDFEDIDTIPNNYEFESLFNSNSNLINAENLVLPATTLKQSCYRNMFYNCGNLISAPELPATTLMATCYESMFAYCTSLTQAPVLPATDITASSCYKYLFDNCSSLNYVKCLAVNRYQSSTEKWLRNVSATGTFIKSTDATWGSGNDGIPNGWTVIEE